MRQIQIRVLIIFTVFIGGCAATSRVSTANKTRENLKDIYILSILAQNYLRNTDGRDFNLDEIIANDSLGRISKNFERIEQISRGGHIAVRYRFSNTRDPKIDLTDKERKLINKLRVIEKKFKSNYDGEIQFEYGERFYHFRKIIIKKTDGTVANK